MLTRRPIGTGASVLKACRSRFRKRRQAFRAIRVAAFVTWCGFLLVVCSLWVRGLFYLDATYSVSKERRSVISFESHAGQVMLLFVQLPEDQQVDTSRTAFRQSGYRDTGFLEWDTRGVERHHRAVPIPLIRRNAQYSTHYRPWGSDGISLSVPFGFGYLKLAHGNSATSENGKFRTRLTWMQFILPNWLILAVFGLIPAIFTLRPTLKRFRVRREARVRSGLCPFCGYDLRGTPDRCPECGRAASNTTKMDRRDAMLAPELHDAAEKPT